MPKIGELIDIKHGYAYKGKYIVREKNDNILVTPGNFYVGGGFKNEKNKYYVGESIEGYILKPNDIIIAMTDLSKETDILGYAARVPSDGCQYLHNQRIGLVTVKSKDLNPDYLYWVMRSKIYQKKVAATATGSTVKHTSPKLIKEINIEVPSLLRQKKIANLMNNIEQRIILNNKINNNLEQQAMTIYKQCFDSDVNQEWKKGVLSDVADITMGQSPIGTSLNTEGNGTLFFQGRTDFSFRFPNIRLFTTEPKRMASINDILMSVRAPVGDLNVAHIECCIGRGLAAIRSKLNHQSFIFYTLRFLKRKLDSFNGEGTVFGSINKQALNNFPILIPPAEKIDEFETLVSFMDLTIRNNYNEIHRLNQMRDILLPKLLSGELDVSNIDI
ncbi:restriction endonuclease subunit S [Veillonella sp. VA141]|uniref:restriction endonuclease subunit S n=1 Tax=Veillonella sp. VA141 TaxID=741833 RepID=UPI000F8D644F|nr:restriction endonuclease subunit S [Veillonella sp. VA141]